MKQTVVIFTQPDCSALSPAVISYGKRGRVCGKGITTDPAAVKDLTEKYSSHSTPALVIGEEVIIGFNPEGLDEILGE